MKENKKGIIKWIILILFAVTINWAINNMNLLGEGVNKIISIIFPFILGGALAFILNIPMSFFEKKLVKIKNKKILRMFSLILAIIVIIVIVFFVIKLIVPELINITKMLIDNIPHYLEELRNIIERNPQNIQDIEEIISNINIDEESIKIQVKNLITNILFSSVSIVGGVINGIVTGVLAVIFAIYILISKETILIETKKIIKAYIKRDKAEKIMKIAESTNKTFKKFFTVQCLEAIILGSLCIIGMLILKLPYAISIGMLIGVTALIPIVGAFIGIIIGAILILSISPIKAVVFIIFVLILQQIEGNLIYPKVVGNSVGLPAILVLISVSIGGSLFGILGMLLSVPTVSVIYSIVKKDTNKRLKEQRE